MDILFYILLASILISASFALKGIFYIDNKSKAFKIFLVFNIVFGMLLAGVYLFTTDIDENNQFLNLYSLLFFVLCLALPPTFYLYVKALTQSMSAKDSFSDNIKHYCPSVLLLVINLFAFVFLNVKDENSTFFSDVQLVMEYSNLIAFFFILLFQVIIYLFLTIIAYRRYRTNFKNIYSFTEGVNLKWLLSFIMGFFVFIILIYLVQLGIPKGNIVFGSSVFIYVLFINYNAFNQELVYSSLKVNGLEPKNRVTKNLKINELKDQIENENNEKESKIQWMPALIRKLEAAMKDDKIFKDTSLNLFQLSNYLGSNTKYLSYTINNHFNKNFTSYINEYRILESIELLSDPEYEQFTLEHIAEMSGFKSRSSFISSFKKMKNTTPSNYKRELKSK